MMHGRKKHQITFDIVKKILLPVILSPRDSEDTGLYRKLQEKFCNRCR